MQGLSSLDPRAMRGWFLRVLNSQGQWKREWYCTRCGQGVMCTELVAPTALQIDGREQVPPPGKHIPHKVLDKRVGGRGQPLPQTSHTETSGVGPGDQVETEHPPTAEMESDLRRTGNEDWRASKGGGRASERCEASDVKDEEGEDADPPQWTSPPREDDDVFYLFFQKQK